MKSSGSPKPSLDLSANLVPFPESLEKHKRYKDSYGKHEMFWGLGIECESYLELVKPVWVKADFIIKNHKRERYSVDYFTSYKQEPFEKAFQAFQPVTESFRLPMLLNTHALTKLDSAFRHQTLYEKNTPPNPAFHGPTLFQLLQEKRPAYFRDKYDVDFTFDGDSIEIMTQNFYKATVSSVLSEFSSQRSQFETNLKQAWNEIPALASYGDIKWTSGNHGFAIMATNPKNLAIFNNGTYHINITLPTELDENGKIKDWNYFVRIHKAFIRYVQWLEPLLVANFGSPDPMAWIVDGLYALGSQRGAMSRYIGLGTYDTSTMLRGKLLTMDAKKVKSSWYTDYHMTSGYTKLEKVGLDINFNKHWNHGVELRFFDWFPEHRLQGLLKVLVYLGDLAIEQPDVDCPLQSSVWNSWMVRVLQKGKDAGCSTSEAEILSQSLQISCPSCNSLENLFAHLYSTLRSRFQKNGPSSRYFFAESVLRPVESVTPAVTSVGCCCLPKQIK